MILSFQNFLSEIFNGTRTPALLKTSTEKNTVRRLKNDIKQLNQKLAQLQALLEAKEAEISHLRSMPTLAPESSVLQGNNSVMEQTSDTSQRDDGSKVALEDIHDTGVILSNQDKRIVVAKNEDTSDPTDASEGSSLSGSRTFLSFQSEHSFVDATTCGSLQTSQTDNIQEMLRGEYPEVKTDFQLSGNIFRAYQSNH